MNQTVKREKTSVFVPKKENRWKPYWKNRYLFLIFLPAILYYAVFHYAPLYGIQMAFREYDFSKGILGSPWVGLQNFIDLFSFKSFCDVLRNTVLIGLYKFVWGFPMPIVFAILLNEVKNTAFKKSIQTISYLPHFLSWVVLGGVFTQLLSPNGGPVNAIIKGLGFNSIHFLASPKYFRTVLVCSSVWKNIGWGSIVYFAALAGIDPQLYEASYIDGANRFHRMWYITLPSLAPVVTIMMIMNVGTIINDDFDQIFNLYNTAVYEVADVISTYTYRVGLVEMNYSLGTAVGLFKNVIAFILILTANSIAKRINDYALW